MKYNIELATEMLPWKKIEKEKENRKKKHDQLRPVSGTGYNGLAGFVKTNFKVVKIAQTV